MKSGVTEIDHPVEVKRGALVQLGVVMGCIGRGAEWPGHGIGLDRAEYEALDEEVLRARLANGWSTEENVRFAFSAWAGALQKAQVQGWLSAYRDDDRSQVPKTVGLVPAGNVPLVGLHDALCVFISGHRARVKCSAQEPDLLPALLGVLDHFLPGTADRFTFIKERLGQVDAVIATGSDNTARYFEHYFGHLPRIVRKSRVGVAVLDGSETEEELTALGEDVFRYFGLGCRNVSKVYVPEGFDLDRLFQAFFGWKEIIHHNKYANN